jgi:hypothetical protein
MCGGKDFQNTHGKEKHSWTGRSPSWKFFFAVYLKKTPGKDAIFRVSNWRHPAKKGAVMLL